MHGGFGNVKKHQALQAHGSHLTADLAAYGAGGSGHQHGFAFELVHHLVQVDVDFFALQQVFDIYGPHFGFHAACTAAEFTHRRHNQHLYASFFTIADDAFLFVLHAFVIGEQNALDIAAAYHFGKFLLAAQKVHRQAGQAKAFQFVAVYAKAPYVVFLVGLEPGFDRSADVAQAINKNILTHSYRDPLQSQVVNSYHNYAQTDQACKSQEKVQAGGYPQTIAKEEIPKQQHKHQQEQHFEQSAQAQVTHFAQVGVADDVAVSAETQKSDQAHCKRKHRNQQNIARQQIDAQVMTHGKASDKST